MLRIIGYIALFGASIGVFVGYVKPQWALVQEKRVQLKQYEEAAANARALQAKRDELLKRRQAMSLDDISRLSVMLPRNVDNVKLTLEINRIARQYNLVLQNVQVEDIAKDAQVQKKEAQKEFRSIAIDFTVSGGYNDFVDFLGHLEKSLRIINIGELTFKADNKTGLYKFTMRVRTYWLPSQITQ